MYTYIYIYVEILKSQLAPTFAQSVCKDCVEHMHIHPANAQSANNPRTCTLT